MSVQSIALCWTFNLWRVIKRLVLQPPFTQRFKAKWHSCQLSLFIWGRCGNITFSNRARRLHFQEFLILDAWLSKRVSLCRPMKLTNLLHLFQTVAPDRLKIAIRKIQDDPYDVEAWNLIVKDATSKKIDDARATFERLVSYFPTSGRFWKLYIEAEVCHDVTTRGHVTFQRFPFLLFQMRYRNYERVEKVINRRISILLAYYSTLAKGLMENIGFVNTKFSNGPISCVLLHDTRVEWKINHIGVCDT